MRKLDAAIDRWLSPPNDPVYPIIEFEFDYDGFHFHVVMIDGRITISMYVGSVIAGLDYMFIENPSAGLMAQVEKRLLNYIDEVSGDL